MVMCHCPTLLHPSTTPLHYTTTTPLHYTSPLHPSTTPLHYTSPLHLSTTPLHYTPPLHPSTTPLHYTSPLHHSTTPLHYTPPLHHSTTPLHYTHTLCAGALSVLGQRSAGTEHGMLRQQHSQAHWQVRRGGEVGLGWEEEVFVYEICSLMECVVC